MKLSGRSATFLAWAGTVLWTATVFAALDGDIVLPGTQPLVVEPFDSPIQCLACHQGENNGWPVTIGNNWRGSMMGNAARDPLFYAALAIANKDREGSGEFCIRCHSPGGWLEGRSDPPTGEGLSDTDLHGVQCDVCHRIKDAMIPDSTANPPVPGYGSGMMVMQVPLYPKRGPFPDAFQFHSTVEDSFQRSSNLCGTCHNVSNPFYATDPVTQPPHAYGVIERTYSEWLLSDFPARGQEGTCQGCHLPPDSGYGCIVPGAMLRPNVPRHDLTGGNTFVPDILYDFWGSAVDTGALRLGKERAMATLARAADLEATAEQTGASVSVAVLITNLTGHKLPTGYPEGRRMWLFVTGHNNAGQIVFQSGVYDFTSAELHRDDQLKVYESKPGLTEATASEFGLEAGPSFHFVLNDTVYFDNRIPPEGFTNTAFDRHLAGPVGYQYADGQYWDTTHYTMPQEVSTVTAILYYQTASKEYITFLRDENVGNPNDWNSWGDSLYAAWERHGKSAPVIIDSITVPVVVVSASADADVPLGTALEQNYPNPFNPTTSITYSVGSRAHTVLNIYDLSGRQVADLVDETKDPGTYHVTWSAGNQASGIYFYRLSHDGRTWTRKLVLLR